MSYDDEDYEDDGIESLLDDDDEGLDDYSAYGEAGWQPEGFEDYLYDRAGKDSYELQSFEGWYAEGYGKKLLDSFLDHVDGMEDETLEDDGIKLFSDDFVIPDDVNYSDDFGQVERGTASGSDEFVIPDGVNYADDFGQVERGTATGSDDFVIPDDVNYSDDFGQVEHGTSSGSDDFVIQDENPRENARSFVPDQFDKEFYGQEKQESRHGFLDAPRGNRFKRLVEGSDEYSEWAEKKLMRDVNRLAKQEDYLERNGFI